MTTTINKVDDFLEAFPNKIIKHTGCPDYEVLNNLKMALKRNFATVPCTLGGGARGYLGAVLKSTRWEKKDCGSYCHTHGYLVGPKHNSETCRQPGPNHN